MTDMNYKFEVGKWYKTRNGWDAQIWGDHFKGPHGERLAGKIQDKDGVERVRSWQSNGSYIKNTTHAYDLMPPVETKEYWVNVYGGYCSDYKSKSCADDCADDNRIGLLKIITTGDEYTIEKVKL